MARKKELGESYTTTIKLLKENEAELEIISEDKVSLSEFVRSAIMDKEIRDKTIQLAKKNKELRKSFISNNIN